MKIAFVITSINKPNNIVRSYAKLCKKKKIDFIIIGDQKSPKNFTLKYAKFFNIKEQKKLNFNYTKICISNSYVRKNIGYLIAIKNGANLIVESDDDNYPKNNFFSNLDYKQKCLIIRNKGWINVFDYFKKSKKKIIWPRGYPLDEIKTKKNISGKVGKLESPIQQHLSSNDPDVDAIYRLTHKQNIINFKNRLPLAISNGTFSTFNSQNTRWFRPAFPLLYLPTMCTFRSCDIWRGLVALRILHLNSQSLIYSSATNFQIRNYHNFFKDFLDEIPVYLNSKKIIEILYSLKLTAGENKIMENLFLIYSKLIQKKIFPKKEMVYLNAWLKDLKKFK